MDLTKLKLGAEVESNESDSLGGGYTLESGVYPMKIDMAYIGKSQGGAMSVNMTFTHGQQSLKHTFWVTSGDAKGNKSTYEKDGKHYPLPGLNMVNGIVFLTLGKELGDLTTETKTVNVWNYDSKAEVPTQVEVLMDLLGQDIVLGVQKRIVDKNVKNDNGVYVPSGETRQENEVSKVFQAGSNLTVSEVKAGETAGEFMQKWADKWTGLTIDKSTASAKGNGSTAGAPPAAAAASASLFPSS